MKAALLAGWATAVLGLALGGCAERPQSVQAPVKKLDGKAWDKSDNAFVAKGWTPGDAASWNEQLRARSQGQNEYTRTAGR